MVGSKSVVAGVVSLAFLAGQVVANGIFKGLEINGKLFEAYNTSMSTENPGPAVIGWKSRQDPDNNFVLAKSVQHQDIICNKDATPAQTSATVQAGDKVVGIWLNWPESHKGPIITYLARCNGSCTAVDKTKLEFFKIHQKGLLDEENPTFWATDALIQNDGRIEIPIPADIMPGEYVMRHEIIALHNTVYYLYNDGAAQLYPQCVNLNIEGSGSTLPWGELGTKLYRVRALGLNHGVERVTKNYPFPGPYGPYVARVDDDSDTRTPRNEKLAEWRRIRNEKILNEWGWIRNEDDLKKSLGNLTIAMADGSAAKVNEALDNMLIAFIEVLEEYKRLRFPIF